MSMLNDQSLVDYVAALEHPESCMSFNGTVLEDLIPGYRTMFVKGRDPLDSNISEQTNVVIDGSRFVSKKHQTRDLEVNYSLISKTPTAHLRAFNLLKGFLHKKGSTEAAKIIFSDEPDVYFVGTVSKITADHVVDNCSSSGVITVHCSDPYKYSVTEYEVDPDPTELASGNVVFLPDYHGTARSYPTLEAQMTGENGYIGYTNQNEKIIQIGNPGDVESTTTKMSNRLIDDEFHTISSDWKQNQAKLVYQTANQNGSYKHYDFYPASGTKWDVVATNGKGSGTSAKPWHGYGISRTVSASTNWTFTYVPVFWNIVNSALGFMEFSLNDSSGNSVAGIIYSRNSVGSGYGMIRLYVGGQNLVETIDKVQFTKNNKYTGIQTGTHAVYASIEKMGDTVTFSLGGCTKKFTKTGLNAVTTVNAFVGDYLTKMDVTNKYIDYMGFTQHTTATKTDIQNPFGPNNRIKADCGKGEIYINDTLNHGLGALGNDWETFTLEPSENNQIKAVYSDWAQSAPTFKLRYREVFL